MLRKTIFQFLVLFFAVALSLAACSLLVQEKADPAGLPNPASEYCIGLGFVEEDRENEFGQYGVCIFPNGSECDSWDFLGGRCGIEHSYCLQQGFTIQGSTDTNIATCIFNDGSSCDELSFFKGTCGPGDRLP